VDAVGTVLTLPKGDLSMETESAALDDARAFLEAVRLVSARFGSTFSVELDNVQVGWIDSGTFDKGIEIGLIGEWERVLRERSTNA
jgi:hypothetical protein